MLESPLPWFLASFRGLATPGNLTSIQNLHAAGVKQVSPAHRAGYQGAKRFQPCKGATKTRPVRPCCLQGRDTNLFRPGRASIIWTSQPRPLGWAGLCDASGIRSRAPGSILTRLVRPCCRDESCPANARITPSVVPCFFPYSSGVPGKAWLILSVARSSTRFAARRLSSDAEEPSDSQGQHDPGARLRHHAPRTYLPYESGFGARWQNKLAPNNGFTKVPGIEVGLWPTNP
jgi:hypothetical protein